MSKTITIELIDGMVEVYDIPPGVNVIVRDYDVEGVEESLLIKDEYGYPCLVTEYP